MASPGRHDVRGRLQTDHIDLYQIHRPDPASDIEGPLSALSDLIHSSKVRAIGSSTMPASDIVEAQWVAERQAAYLPPALKHPGLRRRPVDERAAA